MFFLFFWHTCGVVVLYSTLFLFTLMTSHRTWECLIQCLLPEWVLSSFDRQGKRRWLGSERKRRGSFPGDQSSRFLLTSKEATSQNKSILHLTSVEHLCFLHFFFYFQFVFCPSLVFFEHDLLVLFRNTGNTARVKVSARWYVILICKESHAIHVRCLGLLTLWVESALLNVTVWSNKPGDCMQTCQTSKRKWKRKTRHVHLDILCCYC